MNKERIEIGDLIDVNFGCSGTLWNMTVLAEPEATGDAWKLRSEDGRIYYVQQYENMSLRAKAAV